MVNQTIRPKAEETKLSLEKFEEHLDKAASYTYTFDGTPAYVYRKMIYFNMKIRDLQRQSRALRRKVPEKFLFER